MFQFFQPIWLTALAGIAIPVIIHLWNQRPGKTLKVGSISLVVENAQRYRNRLRLAEILLLILRCLLIVSIALALAGLQWRSNKIEQSKGWLLMPREGLNATYRHFKPRVDSLLSAGFEFHFFESGFEKGRLSDALADSTERPAGEASYRSIIGALDKQADVSLPIYIFTDQYLHHFSGVRSPVALNLHWEMFSPEHVVIPASTDTTAMQVTIFSQHYTNDARYVQASLEAIRQSTSKRLNITMTRSLREIPEQQDWLFWLEETATPADRYAANVLSYAAGIPNQRASVIRPEDGPLFATINSRKSIIEKDSSEQPADVRWRDGFGQPLLTALQQAGQIQYKLYTHFNPDWNDLPWSSHFPLILYGLLYADTSANRVADQRLIDPIQAMPIISESKDKLMPARWTVGSLTGACWLMAFVLFFLERCISFFYSKGKADE